jgi:hypothetical protein
MAFNPNIPNIPEKQPSKKDELEKQRRAELEMLNSNTADAINAITNIFKRNQIIAYLEAKSVPGLLDFAKANPTHRYDPNAIDDFVKIRQAITVAADAQKTGIGSGVDIQELRSHIKAINTILRAQDLINAKYDAMVKENEDNSLDATAQKIIDKF